jgi:hypothetical protein
MVNFQFGKPGSGKGTLSAKLTTKYDVSQLSAGDLLRSHITEGYVMLYLPAHPASISELKLSTELKSGISRKLLLPMVVSFSFIELPWRPSLTSTEGLVPDDIMTRVVTSKLDQLRNKVGFTTGPRLYCHVFNLSSSTGSWTGFPVPLAKADCSIHTCAKQRPQSH